MRTNCDQARERLSLQLDDELSAHETLMLERHLVRCAACAAFAARARVSTEVLRSAPLEPAPYFWLTRRPASATRFAARVAAVTAAAAAAVLVAVSAVSLEGEVGATSAASGLWPTGAAVHPNIDQNLGVRHVAFERPTPDGPRRGLVRPV
ncbi:MAG TPA: zf-HC2 domain-containing protein [Gaiellaceae bacterium]|nr:zf-HC2 domain-containing protein [Gaiellaceae bacterium]